MDYILVVQAPAYPLAAQAFATESAFARHLEELREALGDRVSGIVLVAPRMGEAEYALKSAHMTVIEAGRSGIVYVPSHDVEGSTLSFWKGLGGLWRRLSDVVRSAAVVHADMSTDIRRPATFLAHLAAYRAGRPTIFVVDIDFRKHAQRFRQLGYWGRGKYWFNRFVQQPGKAFQVRLAVRKADLVLLKGGALVADFGKGRTQVKNFYDTVHADGTILTDAELASKQAAIRQGKPLRIGYFGRMIAYKGIDRVIEAVHMARDRGADVELTLIGDGDQLDNLREQVAAAGLQDHVRFHAQIPYGAPLFDMLSDIDLTIATPLIEDTPRAAFDSLSRGIPLLAFDIAYFRDLADVSGAVVLAQWPSSSALADRLVALQRDKEGLAAMSAKGVAFARLNTQRIWLDRRVKWLEDYILNRTAGSIQ